MTVYSLLRIQINEIQTINLKLLKMLKVCDFCALHNEKCNQLNRSYIKCKEKLFNTQEVLKIFRDEWIPSHLQNESQGRICINCLNTLQHCFSFLQQIREAQNLLKLKDSQKESKLELLSKNQPVAQGNIEVKENTKKEKVLRRLLPKTDVGEKVSPKFVSDKIPRTYKCLECPLLYPSFRQLELHKGTHEVKDISICSYCCSLFANTDALEKHCKEVHDDTKYICLPCKTQYKHKGHLLKHIVHVHNRKELIYYCCLCPPQSEPVEYSSKLALKQHFQAVHLQMTNEDDENDVEVEMNEEFLDEFFLHNGNENSFQFSEWDELDLHLPDVLHLNDEATKDQTTCDTISTAYKCPKCNEPFSNQKTLLVHLSQEHSQQLLICNKCEASFQQNEDLWKHKAMHRIQDTVDHSGLCKICDKTFKSAAALNYHIKTHSSIGSKPHSCPYCKKQFQAHINLKQHLRIVHVQLKKHVCLLCDKQFATLDHLKKHVLSQHQNERKHVCSVCNKRFTQLCHLKQHLAIHSTGKTLCCNVCEEKFWRKIDLERHMLAKHK